MSEIAVSALNGASAEGIVAVRETGLQGMVTLKADLGQNRTAAALKKVTGADMPAMRRIESGRTGLVAWMAPDELLILCVHGDADQVVGAFAEELHDQHHLTVNVSDARAIFEISGAPGLVRDVLGKLTPADMAPDVLAPGEMRRTRLSQVPAAIWFEDDRTVRLICFRSVAQYVFDVLQTAVRPGGEIGYY